MAAALELYLDQNYLSGMVKSKPAFRELAPVLREAVRAGVVAVAESAVHERESRPRPELGVLELLRELSGGRCLPSTPSAAGREAVARMRWTIEHELPERRARPSDDADLEALAVALVQCRLVTCDAFMVDVIRRARLDVRHKCELFSGRRADVERLTERLQQLAAAPQRASDPRRHCA